MNLISISAFWRNDGDDGIGLSYTKGLPELAAQIREGVAYLRDPTRNTFPDTTPQQVLHTLASFAKRRASLTDHECRLAVVYIAYLEAEKLIVTDNYNGVQFMSGADRTDGLLPDEVVPISMTPINMAFIIEEAIEGSYLPIAGGRVTQEHWQTGVDEYCRQCLARPDRSAVFWLDPGDAHAYNEDLAERLKELSAPKEDPPA